jgi:hypothetical protein
MVNYDLTFIQNKKLMKQIRSTHFIFDKGDGTKLISRITSIKATYSTISVNIKVIGTIVHRYRYSGKIQEFCITDKNFFTSQIRKNRYIRQNMRPFITEYFKLFGLLSWQVDIQKVACKETF